MTTEESERSETYVTEKWWHRFLRVLMYVSTCIVLVVAGLLLISASNNYTYSYSYSFEPNYEVEKGEERNCSYYKYDDSVNCGEISTLADLMKRMDEGTDRTPRSDPLENYRRATDAASKSTNGDRENLVREFDAWTALKLATIDDLHSRKIRYRKATHWDLGPMAQSVGLTLGLGILWYLCTAGIYRGSLFIAYGHTRIRRPNANIARH